MYKCQCTRAVFIASEIFQLTHQYVDVSLRGHSDGHVVHKRNDPMCVPWDSQGKKTMQFLFLLHFASISLSEMKI